ncbi:MAG: hypothetical protein ACFBWO_06875 [Paracoccaceae bacterium]
MFKRVGVALLAAVVPAGAIAAPIVLDFDRAYEGTVNARDTVDGETVTNAPNTGIVDDRGLFHDALGVRVSLQRPSGETLPAVLYDTNASPANADPDLRTGTAFGTPELGRVLIAQEKQSDIGLNEQVYLTGGTGEFDPFGFERPDDDVTTATFTFYFDPARYADGVDMREMKLVDLDETAVDDVTFGFSYVDPARADASINGASPLSIVVLESTGTATASECASDGDGDDGVCSGDNSLRSFGFDPTGEIARGLRSFSVTLGGISGGIEALSFDPSAAVPLPAPVALMLSAMGLLYLVRRERSTPYQ